MFCRGLENIKRFDEGMIYISQKVVQQVPIHCLLTEIDRSGSNVSTMWLHNTNIIKTKNCISMFMGQNNLQEIEKLIRINYGTTH